ncbi:MAG: penicillin-binding protein activator [Arenicellales bacterium]|nr:penicillin-binding protein activator [Arenicellales bacterium]
MPAKCIRYTASMRLFHAVALPRLALFVLVLLTVTGCATTTPKPSAPGIAAPRAISAPEPVPKPTLNLAEREPGTSGWEFLDRALRATGIEEQQNFLAAAERFAHGGMLDPARAVLDNIEPTVLDAWMANQFQLLQAQVRILERRNADALRIVDRLVKTQLDSRQALRAHGLALQAHIASGSSRAALTSLRGMPNNPGDDAWLAALYHRLWNHLSQLETEQLTLAADPVTTHPTDAGWLKLARLYADKGWDLRGLSNSIDQWLKSWPNHPATHHVVPKLLPEGQCTTQEVQQIALLLPLTSAYRGAAEAFRDGFHALRRRDSNPAKPVLRDYDFGDKIDLVPAYYEQAIRDGADVVIGPLGRAAVARLAGLTELPVPTVLLGATGAPLQSGALAFDLSVENDARALAERARAAGFSRAMILQAQTDQQRRAAEAAAARWAELGGTLTARATFPVDISDYSTIMEQLFGFNFSLARARALQNAIGKNTRIRFSPRRRQDIDVVFLLADQAQARLLKPQIDFHRAHKLPVYTLSGVFSGKADAVNDLDLEGVIFADMPWMVRRGGRFASARQQFTLNTPYRESVLDRLFALGMDAYALSCFGPQMQQRPGLTYPGATGTLSIDDTGRIDRSPDWLRFVRATPVALPTPPGPIAPFSNVGQEPSGDPSG